MHSLDRSWRLHALLLLAALASAATPPAQGLEHALFELVRGRAGEPGAGPGAVPLWSAVASLALCAAASLVVLRASRLAPGRAALLSLGLAFGLLAAQLLLCGLGGVWISITAALIVLGLSPVLREQVEPAGAGGDGPSVPVRPDGRLLALALRHEGKLDLAFEELRKCPPSEAVRSDLRQLAIEFERRRQFARSQAAFDHLAGLDAQGACPTGRATTQPAADLKFPGSAAGEAALPRPQGGIETLGRYELGEELGRGAMGVVYRGRDTLSGRSVAIKTMPLSREFEPDELETVKRRFFGEAESAGRLNHPNIVTIYATGEEHDLAYIAMELLAGRDMTSYAKTRSLLPLANVLGIVARVADALDYAHRHHVVHRDIKPANIMYDVATDIVKVTDFGIARITDSNRTRTGMVLGTPSFMSPEQLAGKKIDGLSDLYSLGVTLYQLVCGALPFEGTSLAQLMYRISNDPPKDPLALNPGLPDELVQALYKAMAKDKSQRYASGAGMAAALRDCSSKLAAVDLAL